jgi:two-component system, sensor histidine kinase and response regulator
MQKKNGLNNVIGFSDIFNLDDIQRIQDLFADATGVASIITYPDGTPITKPSNFCRLCNEIIRQTETGLSNCFKSDAEIGRPNADGPIIQPCLSGGLWDAGASIIVGGKHIANWLIGQVKNEELDNQQMLNYAKTIGSDQQSFMDALEEVPVMSKEKFEKVANMLYTFVNEISTKAYHNSQLNQLITQRTDAENRLHQEQYLMNNLMNSVPDHIYFKDLESRFIRVNLTQATKFGLADPDQIEGKTDFDFFSEEHAKQAYDDEQKILSTGEPVNKEERETWPDRSDTWVSTTKVPLRDSEGNIVGTFGISRDITRQKKAEQELADERNLLRNLIDNMPDRIYAKDLNSRFIICNEALANRMGKTRVEAVIGKSDFDFLPHDLAEQFFQNEQEIIRTGQPLINHEESRGMIDGFPRWNLTTKVPLRDRANNIIGIVGMGRDITDRKIAEEEIQLKNELLQTINAEKDKFFSILAHDLKGPLSAFLDATQILTEEIHKMSLDEIKDITISMKESASSIYGLLENLLEWSRLKRGRMEFSPERLFVKRKITDCTEILKESARKKDISLNFSVPDDLEVIADSHMFETIIRNLVSNAIKFTPKSGAIFISSTKRPDNSTEIAVRDTGIGMSKELIGRLFMLNEKTNRSGTDGEPSTGLGLLLCKEFIEKQNGKIWVESEVGKGSTFYFSLM